MNTRRKKFPDVTFSNFTLSTAPLFQRDSIADLLVFMAIKALCDSCGGVWYGPAEKPLSLLQHRVHERQYWKSVKYLRECHLIETTLGQHGLTYRLVDPGMHPSAEDGMHPSAKVTEPVVCTPEPEVCTTGSSGLHSTDSTKGQDHRIKRSRDGEPLRGSGGVPPLVTAPSLDDFEGAVQRPNGAARRSVFPPAFPLPPCPPFICPKCWADFDSCDDPDHKDFSHQTRIAGKRNRAILKAQQEEPSNPTPGRNGDSEFDAFEEYAKSSSAGGVTSEEN
jgi:hypothetical protein